MVSARFITCTLLHSQVLCSTHHAHPSARLLLHHIHPHRSPPADLDSWPNGSPPDAPRLLPSSSPPLTRRSDLISGDEGANAMQLFGWDDARKVRADPTLSSLEWAI